MIFVFLEDGTLDVIPDIATAQRNYEGIDVESDACMFYDEHGRYLTPQFHVPNRSGKTFGIFPWVISGKYHLIDDPKAREDAMWVKLCEVRTVTPNPWFATLDAVKKHLRGKGVVTDRPSP